MYLCIIVYIYLFNCNIPHGITNSTEQIPKEFIQLLDQENYSVIVMHFSKTTALRSTRSRHVFSFAVITRKRKLCYLIGRGRK